MTKSTTNAPGVALTPEATLAEQEAWLADYVTRLSNALSTMPSFVNTGGALGTLRVSREALRTLRAHATLQARVETLEKQNAELVKLLLAVTSSEFGIACGNVDGRNWFDARAAALNATPSREGA